MSGGKEITNSDNIIDSRDVTERIAVLENMRLVDAGEAGGNPQSEWTCEAQEELLMLQKLSEEAGCGTDWRDGIAFISDEHFQKYAEEMASDIHGRAISEAQWPFDHIDWEAAAYALRQDYRSIEINGETYWYRS